MSKFELQRSREEKQVEEDGKVGRVTSALLGGTSSAAARTRGACSNGTSYKWKRSHDGKLLVRK